jgi:hypothetical protein
VLKYLVGNQRQGGPTLLETPILAAIALLVVCGIVWGCTDLVRSAAGFYIAVMIGRPCKPDPDMKWLWRTLLPGTPLPSCDSKEVAATPVITEDGGARPLSLVQRSWLRKLWPERSQSQ